MLRLQLYQGEEEVARFYEATRCQDTPKQKVKPKIRRGGFLGRNTQSNLLVCMTVLSHTTTAKSASVPCPALTSAVTRCVRGVHLCTAWRTRSRSSGGDLKPAKIKAIYWFSGHTQDNTSSTRGQYENSIYRVVCVQN